MLNPERALVYRADDHACNQAIVITLKSGEVIAIFNEERTLDHADNGYTSIIRSKDGGYTWDQPTPVNIRPVKHGGTRVGVMELPDGGLLLPMYGRIQDFHFFGPGEQTRAFFVRSDDGGYNWEYYSTIAFDPSM